MNIPNEVNAGACGSIPVCNWLAAHPKVGSPREKAMRSQRLQVEFQSEVQWLVELLGRGLSSWSNL